MSVGMLVIEEMVPSQLPELASALAQAGLPSEDVAAGTVHFLRCRDESGALVGFVGLEIKDTDALLRSVLVPAPLRRRGIGSEIVATALDHAVALGVQRIFLLTMTAADFFAALGFAATERTAVPEPIGATAEFSRLCPTAAVCMMKSIAWR